MQQTEKYKLNLIEPSDPFLPEGLNANTQRLEEVVSGHLEGMDQRVTVLEAHRYFLGTYVGDGTMDRFVNLGFTPIAIFVGIGTDSHLAVTGFGDSTLSIKEGGIQVTASGMLQTNYKGTTYPFFAFI